MNYIEKLKDPRWQKKRLKIMERDKWTCQSCQDKETTLNVHHKLYYCQQNINPWDCPDHILITLCEPCHKAERALRNEIELEIIDTLKVNYLLPQLIQFANFLTKLEYKKELNNLITPPIIELDWPKFRDDLLKTE